MGVVLSELIQAREERCNLRASIEALGERIERGRAEDQQQAQRRIEKIERVVSEGLSDLRASLSLERKASINDTEDLRDRLRVFEDLRRQGRTVGRKEAGIAGSVTVVLFALASAIASHYGVDLPW